MPKEYAPIYTRLAEAGVAYTLPDAWSWLPVDSDCLRLEDANVTFRQLVEQFPADQLLASGVAGQADGELVVNPKLVAEDPGFIVLRKSGGDPFDVATVRGCLYGGPPALRMHHDEKTSAAIGKCQGSVMYASFSMVDTVLLRSLGVAVAPAALLEMLGLGGMQRLLSLVGGSASLDIPKAPVTLPTDEEEDHFSPYLGPPENEPPTFHLTLLAGCLSSLTAGIPELLPRVCCHLSNAEEYLRFNWSGIDVWHPTEVELDNIRYRRGLRSVKALRGFWHVWRLNQNHEIQSFRGTEAPSTPAPSPAKTYFDLLEKLKSGPRNPYSAGGLMNDREANQKAYVAFIDEQFVEPLVDKALQSRSPEDRALYMQMASGARLFHLAMPAVCEMQCQSAEEIRKNEGQLLPPELFKQVHAIGGQLLKAIRDCAAIQKEK